MVVGVKEKANVGGTGVGGGRNEVFGFSVNRMAGSNEAGKGSKFAADGTKGIADGIAWGGFVVAAGKKVVTVWVKGWWQ